MEMTGRGGEQDRRDILTRNNARVAGLILPPSKDERAARSSSMEEVPAKLASGAGNDGVIEARRLVRGGDGWVMAAAEAAAPGWAAGMGAEEDEEGGRAWVE